MLPSLVIHTDPDETTSVINELDTVLSHVQSQNPDEEYLIDDSGVSGMI